MSLNFLKSVPGEKVSNFPCPECGLAFLSVIADSCLYPSLWGGGSSLCLSAGAGLGQPVQHPQFRGRHCLPEARGLTRGRCLLGSQELTD